MHGVVGNPEKKGLPGADLPRGEKENTRQGHQVSHYVINEQLKKTKTVFREPENNQRLSKKHRRHIGKKEKINSFEHNFISKTRLHPRLPLHTLFPRCEGILENAL